MGISDFVFQSPFTAGDGINDGVGEDDATVAAIPVPTAPPADSTSIHDELEELEKQLEMLGVELDEKKAQNLATMNPMKNETKLMDIAVDSEESVRKEDDDDSTSVHSWKASSVEMTTTTCEIVIEPTKECETSSSSAAAVSVALGDTDLDPEEEEAVADIPKEETVETETTSETGDEPKEETVEAETTSETGDEPKEETVEAEMTSETEDVPKESPEPIDTTKGEKIDQEFIPDPVIDVPKEVTVDPEFTPEPIDTTKEAIADPEVPPEPISDVPKESPGTPEVPPEEMIEAPKESMGDYCSSSSGEDDDDSRPPTVENSADELAKDVPTDEEEEFEEDQIPDVMYVSTLTRSMSMKVEKDPGDENDDVQPTAGELLLCSSSRTKSKAVKSVSSDTDDEMYYKQGSNTESSAELECAPSGDSAAVLEKGGPLIIPKLDETINDPEIKCVDKTELDLNETRMLFNQKADSTVMNRMIEFLDLVSVDPGDPYDMCKKILQTPGTDTLGDILAIQYMLNGGSLIMLQKDHEDGSTFSVNIMEDETATTTTAVPPMDSV